MEELYRKVGNRYVKCGYGNTPDLHDGIWLIQSNKGIRSTTSLIWLIGNIPLADMNLHASLQKHANELTNHLLKLSNPESNELEVAKEYFGGYVRNKLEIFNWSYSDVVHEILRKLATLIQKENGMGH